jgi:ABC-2 type transport system permease protein
MTLRRELVAVARLELAEVLRSRWLLFCLGIYAVLGAVFVLVGMRESSVMGFTGMGRVLLALCHALVLLLPLLGLTATGQVVNRAREEGALELLFSHPVGRTSWFVAVSLVRFLALLVPLAILLPALAVWGLIAFGEPVPWGFLARALGISAALLAASVGTGLLISTWVRNQAKALMLLLAVWAGGVALLDFALIGLMLQWRLDARVVFALAAVNPVQSARMALLSAATPELGTLGPVGFFLANRIGAGALLALGLVWPLLVGLSAWSLSLRSFGRGDVV